MSKRREKARDAAEDTCRALRMWLTEKPANQQDFSKQILPHLQRWIRNSGTACYDPPKGKQ